MRPEDVDLVWPGEDVELQHARAKAVSWLGRAGELAIGRYEIDDALALLHRALRLDPDVETEASLWRAIGNAHALKFDGDAFAKAMESSLQVSSSRATSAETYSELAFQTSIRSGMWPKRPDPELVGGWIDRAIELSEPESAPRSRALIARSYWERKDPEVAREASELADRLDDLDLRSYAWGARATVDFAAGEIAAQKKSEPGAERRACRNDRDAAPQAKGHPRTDRDHLRRRRCL